MNKGVRGADVSKKPKAWDLTRRKLTIRPGFRGKRQGVKSSGGNAHVAPEPIAREREDQGGRRWYCLSAIIKNRENISRESRKRDQRL